jgi:hypothetical protein
MECGSKIDQLTLKYLFGDKFIDDLNDELFRINILKDPNMVE